MTTSVTSTSHQILRRSKRISQAKRLQTVALQKSNSQKGVLLSDSPARSHKKSQIHDRAVKSEVSIEDKNNDTSADSALLHPSMSRKRPRFLATVAAKSIASTLKTAEIVTAVGRKRKISPITVHRAGLSSFCEIKQTDSEDWEQLLPVTELRCEITLMSGQAFGWTKAEAGPLPQLLVGSAAPTHGSIQQEMKSAEKRYGNEWRGVIGRSLVALRETEAWVEFRLLHSAANQGGDKTIDVQLKQNVRDYFRTQVNFARLYEEWASSDVRFKAIAQVLPGMRILRQPPVECLFSFICSSNNNIGRITKMLNSLRIAYGNDLGEHYGIRYHSFPTVESLAAAEEKDLRSLGLGYRAKFVLETAKMLQECGSESFLLSLREKDSTTVRNELLRFQGIGPKVADCIALFSLDQHSCIPVDTHVWQIACREMDSSLKDAKSLTPAVYQRVGDLFRERYKVYPGWAHSVLFAAELKPFRELLPLNLRVKIDEELKQEKERKKLLKKSKKTVLK